MPPARTGARRNAIYGHLVSFLPLPDFGANPDASKIGATIDINCSAGQIGSTFGQ
jgi:hypothetical protein